MTKVVLIHWGEEDYSLLAKRQAQKYNDVEFLMPTKFRYSLEVDRWFILRDWMLDYRVQRCLYIDSDVLLLKDVELDFTECDMAFSCSHSGHTMFVNNFRVLNDFCQYIEHWMNKDCEPLVKATKARLPDNLFADTVGDMVLLNNFMYSSKAFFRDTYKPVGNSVYDHNVNIGTVGWSLDTNKPFRIMSDGYVYDLNSIHFQGGAKERMKEWAKTYLGL
jgi:hypothetical protein